MEEYNIYPLENPINNLLPISNEFLNFANPNLSLVERNNLGLIFNQVFTDLNEGHSCSNLTSLLNQLNLNTLDEALDLLNKSNLAKIYTSFDQNLAAYPLALIKINNTYLIYLAKYLAYEQSIVSKIQVLNNKHVSSNQQPTKLIDGLKNLQTQINRPNLEQLQAIINSSNSVFSIISGGPGTGKTTTLSLLLWYFYQCYGLELKVKLAAPTGKAALKMKTAIEASIGFFDAFRGLEMLHTFKNLLMDTNNFTTIHKLLGYRYGSIYFKHNTANPLDCEVLIIDESSMVGVALFSKLLASLDPTKIKHVILLGDSNQLSSVEEGYVFSSLVQIASGKNLLSPLKITTSQLTISNRNIGDVAALATRVLNQDIVGVLKLLKTSPNLKIAQPELKLILNDILQHKKYGLIKQLQQASQLEPQASLKALTQMINLSSTNLGVLGTNNLNSILEHKIKESFGYNQEWYPGRMIMILKNDDFLGLFNGDIGITRVMEDKPTIYFESGKELNPGLLPEYSLAYVITIHKSQGSEYQKVNLILPNTSENIQQLLSLELIYTGVSRAKEQVSIFAEEASLTYAIRHKTIRNSGLSELNSE